MDCIFCEIAKGNLNTEFIYEDDKVVAFHDLNPQAPIHFLVIPKEHIKSANHIDEDNLIVSHIFKVIKELANSMGFAEKGYRVINNCGEDGGQTVEHLHYHVLAGRNLQWPPG